MTRNELITKWCAAEGGNVSALDAPQARECYAKLRVIIGENFGVDLDDIIRNKEVCVIYSNRFTKSAAIAYRYLPLAPDGKHQLPRRSRKPAKPARKRR